MLLDIDGVLALWDEDEPKLDSWPQDSWEHTNLNEWHRQLHGHFWWSSTLVSELKKITSADFVEPVWCTTWLEHSTGVFAAITDIGHDWAWLPDPGKGRNGPLWWWKAAHARAAIESGSRVVWIDDEIDSRLGAIQRYASPENRAWTHSPDLLAICPNPARGITPEHLEQVARFLDRTP